MYYPNTHGATRDNIIHTMRSLLLAVVAGLAVLAVRINAEEDVAPVEDAEFEIDLDEDMMARMLGDLFDDEDFEDALEQQESNREARARGDEIEKAVEEEKAVDPKDQARYNSFIDTFFRRLNSFARSRFDPLSVGLEKTAKKGGKNAKSSGNKNKGKKGKSNKGKKGNKKSGKKDKKEGKDKNKKNKKNKRHPKDLDLGEEEDNEDETPVEAEDDEEVAEVHDISKREVEFDLVEIEEDDDDDDEESDLEEDDEEESEVRIARSADMEDDASTPAEETSRRGKPAKGKKDSTKKGGKKNGGKKRKGGKKKNNKKSSNKNNNNKKGRKNKSKSKRDAKGSASRTSRASVTGIATVRRQGDVKVTNKQGGKEMRAQFTLGPVDLKVNRKFGKGKDAVTKEARAVSPELTGKLAIQVAASGKAKMTSFRINRPAIVQVEGSLRKSTKGGKSDNNFMERSIARFSPVASKKLKIASREILSAGEPKAQSEK